MIKMYLLYNMGLYTKCIKILNRNVYLTNLLIIPSIVTVILINYDIKNWELNSDITYEKRKNYGNAWLSILFLLISLKFFT